MKESFSTLTEALRWRALHQPEQNAVTFLRDGEQDEATWTYGQLDQRARAIATLIEPMNVVGQRIVLAHPPGLEFVAALAGCFYAGAVAVPVYPPSVSRRRRSPDLFDGLVRDARPVAALTTESEFRRRAWHSTVEPGEPVRWLASDVLDVNPHSNGREPDICASSLAMVQYTSGSTSQPKGVMLTHRNLLTNIQVIAAKAQHASSSQVVIWLPPYHDMGLIGGILHPLVVGVPVVLMEPRHVLQRPLRWLQAVSRYRATASGGPNFAYDLCVDTIRPEERAQLDLSCWELSFNGAEPVRAATIERFSRAFGPCGFRREAFYPCYGLAEATLLVSGAKKGTPALGRGFDRAQLERRRLVPADAGASDVATRVLVGCGRPGDGHDLVIVDPATGLACDGGEIGEIWVSGDSVAEGYWNRPEETQQVFRNNLALAGQRSFLRTGDLGGLVEGELFVTGRLKDLLIVRGRNFDPHDIEQTALASHAALSPNGCAAFSVEMLQGEALVVAAELRRGRRHTADAAAVIKAIRTAISAEHDLRIQVVVLLTSGSVPKTTSGKIRRSACRTAFLEKAWEPVAEDDAVGLKSGGAGVDDPVEQSLRGLLNSIASRAPDRHALAAAPRAERVAMLEAYLTRRLSELLRVSPNLSVDEPLDLLGADSLMRTELLVLVETDLEIVLPAETIEADTSLNELAVRIHRHLAGEPQAEPPERIPATRDAWVAAPGQHVPLTPTQLEFLQSHRERPEDDSIFIFVRTPAGVDAVALEAALLALEQQHDAFRLRFRQDGGAWRQEYADPGTGIHFSRVPAAGAVPGQLESICEGLRTEGRFEFNLSSGPLARVILLDRGPHERSVLIVGFHHLITDALSVAIFVSRLQRAYVRCHRRQEPQDGAAGITFGQWGWRLDAQAQTAAIRRDLDYWLENERLAGSVDPAPLNPRHEESTALASIRGGLDAAETRRFLQRLPTAQQQHDALLAALAGAWTRKTGRPGCYVRLQNHGRHPLGGPPPTTTIGWLACAFPLWLPLESPGDEAASLRQVQAVVGRVPHGGLSFGLLARLCRDTDVRAALRELAVPRLALSYLSLDHVSRMSGQFSILRVSHYAGNRADSPRLPDLWLSAVHRGEGVSLDLLYKKRAYDDETAAELGESIRAFLRNLLR